MFFRNLGIMCFILSPLFVLFGMILFSGKPKDMLQSEEKNPEQANSDERK